MKFVELKICIYSNFLFLLLSFVPSSDLILESHSYYT